MHCQSIHRSFPKVQKCREGFKKECTVSYDEVPRKVRFTTCRDTIVRDCEDEGDAGGLHVREADAASSPLFRALLPDQSGNDTVCSVERETGMYETLQLSRSPPLYNFIGNPARKRE